ncbi:MAG: acetyltransferase [Elusimicrobia bacterium]|nr:acetyltransferase [Elusimicrobiota bacterium]
MAKKIIGIGAGGHAKVVIDILRLSGLWQVVGLVDQDARLWGSKVLDVPVLGGDDFLSELRGQGVGHAFIGVGAGGNPGDARRRAELFNQLSRAGFQMTSAVHPRAVLASSVRVGQASTIMAGAIINPSVEMGCNVIINTGAIVEHDCKIADHAHVATGAHLAGQVSVGEAAHIGIGAIIRQGITIGQDAVVAAGAVVVKDVEPGVLVAGVPAAPLKLRSPL